MDRILFLSKVPEEIFKKSFRKALFFSYLAVFSLCAPLLFRLDLWQSSPLFFIFLFLVTIGFRSHKRLEKLKNNPTHLYVSENGITWDQVELSYHQICSIAYVDEKIVIETKEKKYFLAYFSEKDFLNLKEISQDLLSPGHVSGQAQ